MTPRGRWSATAVFLLSGLAFGGFLVRTPALKVQHQLGDTAFGLLNLLFGVVAILAMSCAAPLLRRVGAPRVARVALLVLPVSLALLGAAPSTAGYVAVTVLVAAANGLLDVAMNATAVEVETQLGRPVLSGCHAAWSVGTVVSTAVGTASIAAGVPTAVHLAVVAAVAVPLGALIGTGLPPTSGARPRATPQRPARSSWSPAVWRISLTAVVLMVAEGSALAWSGVLLHEVRHAPLAVAAASTTAFTAAQTVVRLVGDHLRTRWGDERLFRGGAVLGAVGMGVAALAPDPLVVVAGFALLGLGTAVLVPIAYAETGRRDPTGRAVLRLTTFVYAGVLAGPGAIGFVAGAVGLAVALAAVAPLLAAAAVLFPGRRSRSAPVPEPLPTARGA